ncbi:alpha-mannosidase [Hydrogenispora ethanolica]|uniref:Alpha-mannosidase n=1 Tax=Hydrogenispora ethanolica TaxID=1082276 RepID=A0A4R1RDA2_HYDET|nr:alpha-mannosidase [Hydrogenispora ethanolica]TCL63806.1 alpha-mannosidase [Hydrogenispora ethanolica]
MSGHEETIATCIGHTHIDIAWLWTIEQTREKVARSFSTVLRLMEEYPEYNFMSSQPQLYQYLKEDYPELYAQVKERIREGRWEADGAMWLEADCNLTSGESLVRQILFGTRFFEREFGVKNKVLWLPDVFGYSAALPQILKKSGIDYFVTTKISWNQFNKLPYDTFMWRGLDGTEILSYFICTIYPGETHHPFGASYNGLITPRIVNGTWERYQQKEINNDIMIAYGYGDGGGGPTAEMLENARRLSKGLPGCPRVKLGKVGDYLEKLSRTVSGENGLPKWVGELYLEFHRGTYTSMSWNKRYNRKCEFLYQDAEFLAALAMLLGENYPQTEINQGWETILLNQFHDIIPGSCIKEVYDHSRQQYEQLLQAGRQIAGKAMAAVAARIDLPEPAVVVYNTLSFRRNDLVTMALPESLSLPSLLNQDGSPLPVQIVEEDGCKKALFYAPEVPAKGYQAFTIGAQSAAVPTALAISPEKLENRFFSISIDSKGTISSFYDKRNRREVLQSGERGNKLQAFEDKPMNWDNWDIDIYYQEQEWEIDQVEAVEVLETGPVRGGVLIKKRFQDSVIIQKIYIYQDIPRVDFDTLIDWKEDQILLKAAFPVDVHADKATYDIQFGNVERPTHWNTSWDWARFEVCAHKWADLSENGFGVSLLNDCKYGYDIKDGNMRLTLLKSGNYPNPEADREEHRFLYSLYPHAGDWREGKTVPMAYSLNVPLYAKLEGSHPASLPQRFSFLELDRENVVLETVKKAEDGNELIIRAFECHNQRSRVRLTGYGALLEAWECDLLEKPLQQLEFCDGALEFEIKPYEIKTLKLRY